MPACILPLVGWIEFLTYPLVLFCAIYVLGKYKGHFRNRLLTRADWIALPISLHFLWTVWVFEGRWFYAFRD